MAKPPDESLVIHGPHLVERHEAGPVLEPARDAPWIGLSGGCHRRNDDGVEVLIELIGRHDKAGPRLANLAAQRRVEAYKMDLAACRTAPPCYHVHSRLSKRVGKG